MAKGKGAGFAQSGGKATSFQGGGGSAGGFLNKNATSRKAKGKGGMRPGNQYSIVDPGGDISPTRGVGKAAKASGVAHGQGASKKGSRAYHKPDLGMGGSN